MDLPLFVLLIPYLLAIGIFFLWTFFNLYHIVRFGLFDFTGKLNTGIFMALTAILLFLTFLMLRTTPWLDTFPAFTNFSIETLYSNPFGTPQL